MWVISGTPGQQALMGKDVSDRPDGEHDQTNPPLQHFMAGVVDPEPDGGEGALSMVVTVPGSNDAAAYCKATVRT
jgi:hypothetical protein